MPILLQPIWRGRDATTTQTLQSSPPFNQVLRFLLRLCQREKDKIDRNLHAISPKAADSAIISQFPTMSFTRRRCPANYHQISTESRRSRATMTVKRGSICTEYSVFWTVHHCTALYLSSVRNTPPLLGWMKWRSTVSTSVSRGGELSFLASSRIARLGDARIT